MASTIYERHNCFGATAAILINSIVCNNYYGMREHPIVAIKWLPCRRKGPFVVHHPARGQSCVVLRRRYFVVVNPLSVAVLGAVLGHVSETNRIIGSGHMVRNKLHWDANDAVGLPKQRNSYQSNPTFLCFGSPTASFASQYNLFRIM